jgi:hypothetical protein
VSSSVRAFLLETTIEDLARTGAEIVVEIET